MFNSKQAFNVGNKENTRTPDTVQRKASISHLNSLKAVFVREKRYFSLDRGTKQREQDAFTNLAGLRLIYGRLSPW